ncbi:hypothetical protein ACN47E_006491 [Coniothyrium glycines]
MATPIPAISRWPNPTRDALDILHWQANATIAQHSGFEHTTVLQLDSARVVLLAPSQKWQHIKFKQGLCNIKTKLVSPSYMLEYYFDMYVIKLLMYLTKHQQSQMQYWLCEHLELAREKSGVPQSHIGATHTWRVLHEQLTWAILPYFSDYNNQSLLTASNKIYVATLFCLIHLRMMNWCSNACAVATACGLTPRVWEISTDGNRRLDSSEGSQTLDCLE